MAAVWGLEVLKSKLKSDFMTLQRYRRQLRAELSRAVGLSWNDRGSIQSFIVLGLEPLSTHSSCWGSLCAFLEIDVLTIPWLT
jgi:hypothetical protein